MPKKPSLRATLLKLTRAIGDANAVRRDKVPKRVVRRGVGKGLGNLMKKALK